MSACAPSGIDRPGRQPAREPEAAPAGPSPAGNAEPPSGPAGPVRTGEAPAAPAAQPLREDARRIIDRADGRLRR